jgi:hypothetical protein
MNARIGAAGGQTSSSEVLLPCPSGGCPIERSPRCDSDSGDGRTKNLRVDVVVLKR